MVKNPVHSSEYLSLGGASLDKLMEMSNVATFINDFEASEIEITIHDEGSEQTFPLTYFKPNYPPVNGTQSDYAKIEYIDNLFYTLELNPPDGQIFVNRPDGIFIHLMEGEEINQVLEECYDVADKLRDCIDTIRSGKKLDSTQEAFLKTHNVGQSY